MAHRMFSDASGREWLVWDVVPYTADHRDGAPRSNADASADDGRRITPRSNPHLPTAFAAGWLCFESGAERRRLGPIPESWHALPDERLQELMERAAPVPPRDSRYDTAKLRAMARPGGDEPRTMD